MASIIENKRGEKVISYRFFAYLGRTPEGKMIKKTTTWKPPETLTPAKARKAAEVQARQWERDLLVKIQEEEEKAVAPPPPPAAPAARRDDFIDFIDNVWFPLIESLKSAYTDRIQFRIITESSSKGKLPLSFATQFVEGLHDLVLYAACAEERALPVCARTYNSAKRKLDKFQFGQTEYGSFMIRA